MTETLARIVVGLEEGADATVLRQAAEFARRFNAKLVCVISDDVRYAAREDANGIVTSLDYDSDDPDEIQETFNEKLRARVDAILSSENVDWSPRAMAGDPALQLAHVADEVDAIMIIVGTHQRGRMASMREFLNGSVAVHLAHRQHRPVVVVPLSPTRDGSALPWEGSQ